MRGGPFQLRFPGASRMLVASLNGPEVFRVAASQEREGS